MSYPMSVRKAALPLVLLSTVPGVMAHTQSPSASTSPSAPPSTPGALPTVSLQKAEDALVAKHGTAQRARIQRGLKQVQSLWRSEDGDPATFEAFVLEQFAGSQAALDALFQRLEFTLESYTGHTLEISRDFRWHTDLDLGPLQPIDEILSGYDPAAHFTDDAFTNKLAFVVLLNFPMSTLDERLKEGDHWTRRQWAEARLVDLFAKRIPADVNQCIAEATGKAERYIASYNVWMAHVLDKKGQRLFPEKLRLLSHWNLRDELKSQYAKPGGIARQRAIQKVMERIVDQTIPACVIDNPAVDWNPWTNTVQSSPIHDGAPRNAPVSADPEPNTRYRVLLEDFKAVRKADPYAPSAPTHMARSFNEGRQIPEARVMAMLDQVLSSPLVPQVAKLIEHRLGRKLEPFDIWFNGFRPGGQLDEAKLDTLTRQRYPSAEAYKKDMPNLLVKLGFSPERATWLASRIEVDPARGSGHAMGALRRGDNARLRTRVGQDGMDYKGFNIAVHENGHNVEQTFSLNRVDHWLLNGVPNTAFTEALAFVFQAQDLKLLGQAETNAQAQAQAKAEKALNDFWAVFEIAGVGRVDTEVWHWMYAHPNATPEQLKAATLEISKAVWNRYYAPVLGQKDCVLLGIYSHMIHSFLYLPDYAIGHMIAFQIEDQIERTGKLGETFERMATLGRLTPDLWMKQATGHPVGPEALLEATRKALSVVSRP
ncbi:MAG TPA: hypothetical protein PKL14_08150, partial [Holophaga sp.]|nr:hypothetical protein [Holophaga sp.]